MDGIKGVTGFDLVGKRPKGERSPRNIRPLNPWTFKPKSGAFNREADDRQQTRMNANPGGRTPKVFGAG
jgi:hypothetical protein